MSESGVKSVGDAGSGGRDRRLGPGPADQRRLGRRRALRRARHAAEGEPRRATRPPSTRELKRRRPPRCPGRSAWRSCSRGRSVASAGDVDARPRTRPARGPACRSRGRSPRAASTARSSPRRRSSVAPSAISTGGCRRWRAVGDVAADRRGVADLRRAEAAAHRGPGRVDLAQAPPAPASASRRRRSQPVARPLDRGEVAGAAEEQTVGRSRSRLVTQSPTSVAPATTVASGCWHSRGSSSSCRGAAPSRSGARGSATGTGGGPAPRRRRRRLAGRRQRRGGRGGSRRRRSASRSSPALAGRLGRRPRGAPGPRRAARGLSRILSGTGAGRRLGGPHDRGVAGAAAEVARERVVVVARRRSGAGRRRHEARRAEAALRAVVVDHRRLDRVERAAAPRGPRPSAPPPSSWGRNRMQALSASRRRPRASTMHRAGAAVALVAALLGAPGRAPRAASRAGSGSAAPRPRRPAVEEERHPHGRGGMGVPAALPDVPDPARSMRRRRRLRGRRKGGAPPWQAREGAGAGPPGAARGGAGWCEIPHSTRGGGCRG